MGFFYGQMKLYNGMKPLFLSVLLEVFEDPTPRTRDRESFRRSRSRTRPHRAPVRFSLNNPPDFGDQSELLRTDPEKYVDAVDRYNKKFIRWNDRTLGQRKRRDARIAKLQDQERRKAILAKIKDNKRKGRLAARAMAQEPDPETRSPATKKMIRLNTGRNRAGPGHPNYDPGYGSLSKKLGLKIRDPEGNK